MKKLLLTALLTLGVAATGYSAGTAGDLILGFRDDGSDGGSGTTNTTIDLGSITAFTSGGTFYDPAVTVSTGINLTTDGLATTYGASYLSDSGLFFGIVGTNGTSPSTRGLYVTADADGSPLNGTQFSTPTSAWNVASATSQSTQAGKFTTLETNNVGGFNGVSTSLTSISTSWSAVEAITANQAFGKYPVSVFENAAPSGSALDLFAMIPQAGSGTPGVFLGTFSIDSSGNLDYTAAGVAIPEPSTYAAILGAVVLAVAIYRRRQHSMAL
jgi:hypothetical protein